jgi:hypothetical protein
VSGYEAHERATPCAPELLARDGLLAVLLQRRETLKDLLLLLKHLAKQIVCFGGLLRGLDRSQTSLRPSCVWHAGMVPFLPAPRQAAGDHDGRSVIDRGGAVPRRRIVGHRDPGDDGRPVLVVEEV